MLVFIKTLSGKTITIDVSGDDTIALVKQKIQERESIPSGTQRILYAGKELEDQQTISECGIKKESILHLLLKTSEKNKSSYSATQKAELEIAQTKVKYYNESVGLQDELMQYRDEETKFDTHSNPAGGGYDLGKDGEFTDFTIAIFFMCGIMNNPIKALEQKGFRILESRDEAKFLGHLKMADIAWIISGTEDPPKLTTTSTGECFPAWKTVPKEIFIEALLEFHRRGGALYVWGDNDPLFEHANAILPHLLKEPVQLIGNTPGDSVLQLGTSGEKGYFLPHIITTGVISLYEGVSISYPEPLGPLKVLAMSSNEHPVICYADNECLQDDNVGRIVVDCGFTKNYCSWDRAGTSRYIVNACVWLLGLEHKTLHNIPIKGKHAQFKKTNEDPYKIFLERANDELSKYLPVTTTATTSENKKSSSFLNLFRKKK